MFYRNLLLLIILTFASFGAYTQETHVEKDVGFWVGANFNKDFFKDFNFSSEYQIRTFKDGSEIDDHIVDLGITQRINNRYVIGSNLRYIYDKKRFVETEKNVRYNFDIKYKHQINSKSRLQYRLRYQQEYLNFFKNFYAPAKQKVFNTTIRNKIRWTIKTNSLNQIFFSSELFRRSELFRYPYFNKIRFYIGNKRTYEIGDLNVSIGLENELNNKYPYQFVFLKTTFVINR